MLYLSLFTDFEWIEENTIFMKPDLSDTIPFALYWVWFCSRVLIPVRFSA